MSYESITILRAQSDRGGSKVFKLNDDGRLVADNKQPRPKYWAVRSEPVAGLDDLASVLGSLEESASDVVIRWELRDGVEPTDVLRRTKGDEATLRPKPQRWCMIDIDDLVTPPELANDPNGMIEYAVRQLPPEFQGVDLYRQFSGSMGLKPGLIKVHLWYWLDRAVSDAEMRAWLSGSPVDMKIYNAAQLHYVARPIFQMV